MWLHTFFSFGLLISATAVENCSPKVCKDVENEKPVCGSDGLTYPNRCQFEKARCQNKNLTLSRRGACRDKRPCLESIAYANAHPQYSFKPLCKPDGSYASTQCHPDTGYCWCVTPQGIPLPYTSVRQLSGLKPRCGKNKKTTRRRSPGRQRKSRRICRQHDKAMFNNNLIRIFYKDWSHETGSADDLGNNSDASVLNWKFKSMDRNNDGLLDKTEYRELKKLVKKVVKPKRCAKSFARACDMNSDQLISRQEWAECLTRDGMDDVKGENTSNADNDYEEEDSEGDLLFVSRKSPPHGVLSGGTRITGGQNYEDDSSELRDDDATDCLSDRQTALSEQHANKHYELYVPDCTPDGRYQKIQCYKSAGYCWCVHEDTGKNIPGTSVKNGTPKCDQMTMTSRPMKGCPDDKKAAFLIDLLQFLHTRMAEVTNGSSIPSANGLAWKASKEEQAATWSFVVFDKNKNKMLDRNEWKSFKEIVASVKSLRRCGKKLPRYCDINKDRQISMTEWLDCLNIQQAATTISPGSTRTGKNPLSLLMED